MGVSRVEFNALRDSVCALESRVTGVERNRATFNKSYDLSLTFREVILETLVFPWIRVSSNVNIPGIELHNVRFVRRPPGDGYKELVFQSEEVLFVAPGHTKNFDTLWMWQVDDSVRAAFAVAFARALHAPVERVTCTNVYYPEGKSKRPFMGQFVECWAMNDFSDGVKGVAPVVCIKVDE